MTSKPQKTDDGSLNKYLRELNFAVNNRIWVLDVPVSKSGILSNYTHGKHPTKLLTASDSAYFGFIIPNSVKEIKEVKIRFIPSVTGTIDYTVNLSYGGVDEDENANTATTGAVTGLSVTDDRITEIDITDLFSAVDADDQIGCELTLDSATTTTDIQVLSLYFKYI
jgi:hypothetical protein